MEAMHAAKSWAGGLIIISGSWNWRCDMRGSRNAVEPPVVMGGATMAATQLAEPQQRRGSASEATQAPGSTEGDRCRPHQLSLLPCADGFQSASTSGG